MTTESSSAESDKTKIAQILAEALGSKYNSIGYWREGGTRLLFQARWGPGSERRVVKVDKKDIGSLSPRAKRHVERGYDTNNDIQTLANIPDAEKNGLTRLLDYATIEGNGDRTAVSVEPYFNSSSLEELVQKEGAIPAQTARPIFSKIFNAANHFIKSTGRLHRDPKPSNILIGTGENEGEVRITDYANSAHKDKITAKYNPTAGSVQVTDWRLMTPLTGKEAAYDEQAEVFAYGMTYLYSRLGKQFVEIDPDAKRAVISETGKSLTGSDGSIDKSKYEQALKKTIESLPRKERKFVKRCLTSDLNERYKSLDELVNGFRASQGTFARMSPSGKAWAIGSAAFAGGIAALLGFTRLTHIDKDNPQMEMWTKMATFPEKYKVESQWNGRGPQLKNGLVEIDYLAFIHPKEGSKEPAPYYPKEVGSLKADPGSKLSVSVSAREIPRPKEQDNYGIRTPSLPGRAYIEGFPLEIKEHKEWDEKERKQVLKSYIVNDFWVTPFTADETDQYHMQGSYGGGYVVLTIPEGTKDGTYIAALEIYEPSKEQIGNYMKNSENNRSGMDRLKFSNPGKMLARERIKIIVGNPSKALDVSYIQFNGDSGPNAGYMDLRERNGPLTLGSYGATDGVKLEFRVPEENFSEIATSQRWGGNLILPSERVPNEDSKKVRTLEILARDEAGQEIFYTAFPIQRKLRYTIKDTGEKIYGWDFGLVDKSFSEKLVEYRKQALSDKQGN